METNIAKNDSDLTKCSSLSNYGSVNTIRKTCKFCVYFLNYLLVFFDQTLNFDL